MTASSPLDRAPFWQTPELSWLGGRGRLSQAIELEERAPSRLVGAAVLVLVAGLSGAVAWASVTRVNEVATTSGEIAPVGTVRKIQHLEGGIVAAIHVREGSIVEAGQKLIELDTGAALPELDQLRARLAALTLQKRQLTAFQSGMRTEGPVTASGYGDIETAQSNVLSAKFASVASQQAVLREQMQQRRTDKAALEVQRERLNEQIELANEQVSTRAGLVDKGLSARMGLLDLQRDHARLRTQHAEVEGQIARAEGSIVETVARLSELTTRTWRESAEELAKMEAELAEVRQALVRAEDKVKRLVIAAPVRGIVKGLQTETLGGVIPPGSLVMEVIPVDVPLIVEARLQSRDIGFVEVGQEATVKVTTYDYTRFGSLAGVVETISATTFPDEKNGPYYRVRIRLSSNHLGSDPSRNLLSTGMAVIADIKTGDKTMLAYLLKPLVRATSEAFRER